MYRHINESPLKNTVQIDCFSLINFRIIFDFPKMSKKSALHFSLASFNLSSNLNAVFPLEMIAA